MSKHREIDCPVCKGPVCELDGSVSDDPDTDEGKVAFLLEGMERIGWPCRLVELPDEYQRLARIVMELREPKPVFILLYTHKHGEDVSVYRTLEGATSAAFELACQRADEGRWHDEEKARFDAAETPEEALGIFHEIELNYNYSECLEITESVLGD